jgi:hypothetical protein
VVNDDTKTFSSDYNDIINSYFGKTLTSQTFPISVQCKYVNKTVFPQIGLIGYYNNRLIYIPFQILKLGLLYQTFPENSSVLFNFLPVNIENSYDYVLPNIYI